MPTFFNIANLYTFFWCIYWLQGPLYPVGTSFSQLLLAVLLIISLYYFIIANIRYTLPSFFIGLNLLVILLSIYGVYFIVMYDVIDGYLGSRSKFIYLKDIWISLLPIYSFYVFFKEKKIDDNHIYFWILFFLVIVISLYFYEQQKLQLIALLLQKDKTEFTNNAGYSVLALLPACVFLYKKPIFQYIAIGTCLIFIFMAMKRGAILIGVISLMWLLWNNFKGINLKKKIIMFILSLSLCCICYLFVQRMYIESNLFQLRVEQTINGDSSGRDDLYNTAVHYFWNETSSLSFIFGSGANATLSVLKNYAHNDWLEIAVNQGLLGLIIYFIYWFFFAKEAFTKDFKSEFKLAIQLLFLICFMKTLFSMSYRDNIVSITFVLGYCLAHEKENEQVIYSD